jgi:hypothetical protein
MHGVLCHQAEGSEKKCENGEQAFLHGREAGILTQMIWG